MIVTVLEARVEAAHEAALQAAFAGAGKEQVPAGLVRTELVRDARDPQRWRLQTWWASRESLESMRSAGTPAGVLMFRAAGVEPVLSIFEVTASLPSQDSRDMEEVLAVVRTFASAWNEHDMKAFSELFAHDAQFVNVVGLWWRGREEIRQAHEHTHASMFRSSTLTFDDVSARLVTPELALTRARWRLRGHVSPEGAPLPDRTGLLLNVISRAGGKWQIVDSQNTDIVEGVLSPPQ